MISVILFKMGKHGDFHRSFFQLYVVTKLIKKKNYNNRVYVVLGDALSKLETFVWILNRISRFITWSPFFDFELHITKKFSKKKPHTHNLENFHDFMKSTSLYF